MTCPVAAAESPAVAVTDPASTKCKSLWSTIDNARSKAVASDGADSGDDTFLREVPHLHLLGVCYPDQTTLKLVSLAS